MKKVDSAAGCKAASGKFRWRPNLQNYVPAGFDTQTGTVSALILLRPVMQRTWRNLRHDALPGRCAEVVTDGNMFRLTGIEVSTKNVAWSV